MSQQQNNVATKLGLEISTTRAAAGIRSENGQGGYASLPMRGQKEWHGGAAYDLTELPGMLLEVLQKLRGQGWCFGEAGSVSCVVRQHDMAVLGVDGELLMPALSWQCNKAASEAEMLNKDSMVRQTVGPIEPRFILPKLQWALEQEPLLGDGIVQVMTTGDYVAAQLTGEYYLSTSDALSNGLLNQKTKELAVEVLEEAGINSWWFPKVKDSGSVVGVVNESTAKGEWKEIAKLLDSWRVIAGLGDNQATGVGCGLSGLKTLVVSAGSSGTVNRLCEPGSQLQGEAACFEFYSQRLLLMMLHECAVWYNRWRGNLDHEMLNSQALSADIDKLMRVNHRDGKGETYPPGWDGLGRAERVASTQFSIVCELLLLVKKMLKEVVGSTEWVTNFVLTGGLSQSKFFQQVFEAGLQVLVEDPVVEVSAREGPLRFQAGVYGALLNCMLPGQLAGIMKRLCPRKACAAASDERRQLLLRKLSAELDD